MVKGGHVLGEQTAHSHSLVSRSTETIAASSTHRAHVISVSSWEEHLLLKFFVASRCNAPSACTPNHKATTCRDEPHSNAWC